MTVVRDKLWAVGQWLTHDFFKASAMIFALGLIGSLLNLACRVVLGRMLTSEQYGEMETMMQVCAYVSVPVGALQMVVAREAARAKGQGQEGRIGDVIWTMGRQLSGYVLAAMALLAIAAPFLRDFFRFNSVWPVFATASIVLSVFTFSIIFGGLQGGHRFWQGSVSSLIGPVFRIGLSWALIKHGFGATGALAALAGSTVAMSLAGFAFAWDLVKQRSRKLIRMAPLYQFIWPIVLTMWMASILGGIDIFIVKRAFSSLTAGDYARTIAVVRLSLFVNGALTVALFPWVASEQAGGRKTAHLLGKALGVGMGISVLAAVFFTVFPGFVLGIFYREVQPVMIEWIRLLGWALIPGSLFTILTQYHMARQEYRFLYWLIPAGAAYGALLLLCRQSIHAIIVAMGAGSLVVVAGLLFPVLLEHRNREMALPLEAKKEEH